MLHSKSPRDTANLLSTPKVCLPFLRLYHLRLANKRQWSLVHSLSNIWRGAPVPTASHSQVFETERIEHQRRRTDIWRRLKVLVKLYTMYRYTTSTRQLGGYKYGFKISQVELELEYGEASQGAAARRVPGEAPDANVLDGVSLSDTADKTNTD